MAVTVTTRPLSTHGWSAVHLPIVYKLTSNAFPINTAATVRTISSVADDNGYCKITVSGALDYYSQLIGYL
jgi:hypothetical protein